LDPSPPPPARLSGRRTLIIYYTLLTVATVAVGLYVFVLAGTPRAPQPIAGGYDLSPGSGCLGDEVDLQQSGQFVDLVGLASGVRGQLRLRAARISGSVRCAGGRSAALRGVVAQQRIEGSVAGRPFAMVFRRQPPPAGAQTPTPPGGLDGAYALAPTSSCLGGVISFSHRRGQTTLSGSTPGVGGRIEYNPSQGTLTGAIHCSSGPSRQMTGSAADRRITLKLSASEAPVAFEQIVATKTRSAENLVAAFFLAMMVVMLTARLTGAAMAKVGQPRVMGEVIAGIVLGPTVFGAISPAGQNALFPSDVVPVIGVAANLGLIFYMFLVGMELDLRQLKGRMSQTFALSNTGVLVPLMAGLLVAAPVYRLVGTNKAFTAAALFLGVAMSITAFPVLARIVVERRMLGHPLGALALASAAIDDVSAWFLISVAAAVAGSGGVDSVVRTVLLVIGFAALMFLVVRRILARAAVAFEEAGRIPATWITAIFVGVLGSAYATQRMGVAVIFGAFVMGAVMPRHAGLTEDITRRVEDFVLTLLLPLFFAYTGLRTNVGLLDRPELVGLMLGLIVIAILGKFSGAILASRAVRLSWRESSVLGALLNTRGLTELIVLNLALDRGLMSQALYTSLVLMALVTTLLAGPLLRLFDPGRRYTEPVAEELERSRRESVTDSPLLIPERSIIVAPQSDAAISSLVAIAEPLARSQPPRELILARLNRPPPGASVRGGLQTESRALAEAFDAIRQRRAELLDQGVAARALAFTSADPAADLVELAKPESVDLLLLDGRRPLLGGGVPRGEVGSALSRAPCDVAVLVSRDDQMFHTRAARPVLVPFGGAEHDWAALELGAWIAAASRAPLKLLGTSRGDEQGRDASRLLANASLLVERFTGVLAEPVIVPAGRDAVVAAAADAGLLVIGLSDRWRREGLGSTRTEIAQAAPAPILFVRRGLRAGALAPRGDMTRFTWSVPEVALPASHPPAPAEE